MIDPVLALTVAVVGGAALVLLFWPGVGLFWRLLRLLRTSDRVLIEDALKHLYDCEYRKTAVHAAEPGRRAGPVRQPGRPAARKARAVRPRRSRTGAATG